MGDAVKSVTKIATLGLVDLEAPKLPTVEKPKLALESDPDNVNLRKRQEQLAAKRLQQSSRAANNSLGNTAENKPVGQ